MTKDTEIDIDVLEAAVRLLAGEQGLDMLRKTYNAMHDVATKADRDGFRDGYKAAERDYELDASADEEQQMADDVALAEQALYAAAADQAFDEPPRIHAHTEGSELDPAFVTELRAREAAFNE